MSWHVAAALVQLEKEISRKWPKTPWPKGYGDGAIGDASHAARKSDHNPDYAHGGVVRAIDIAIGGRDAREILNTVIGDPRVWYVIHKGLIYSRTYGWSARRYTGASSHPHHIHVSIQGANGISSAAASRIEHDTRTWFANTPPKVKPVIYFGIVRDQFLAAATGKKVTKRGGVMIVQANLNRRVGSHLKVDGLVGDATLNAWAVWERKRGVEGRPRVPNDLVDVAALVGSYAVVK